MVALDLRGYGQSSKPAADETHSTYSKRVMAQDCVDVMSKLGHNDAFYICAHDRGARVAHKLCVDHPGRVKKAIFLDIAPTLAMYSKTDYVFAKAYFHWFFLIQPSPLPESFLLNADPEAFLRAPKGAFHPFCLESYKRMLKDPACVHAMCEEYRASASVDLDAHREDEERGRRIQCPLMVLWGKSGIIEKCFDAVAEWKAVSDSSVVGESLDCGHYIPEERPEELLAHITAFLKE